LGENLNILSSGNSDIGRKRKTNQDSICLLTDEHFFAVADGMGGHSGGDIASQMSVKLFPEFLAKNKTKMEVPDLLDQSIKFINRSIFDHGQANQDLRGMGTTISALMFSDKFVNIANIGDSRVYMVHNKKLFQMTRDHSLVQEKLNLGIYDRQGAKEDPQKNVLIRTVGFEPEVEVDVYKYRVSKSDLFLICSDGLHGKVCDEDILDIVNKNITDQLTPKQEQLDNAVKQLIDQANANGGQDNISVILAITT
jgi:protein phosphatase